MFKQHTVLFGLKNISHPNMAHKMPSTTMHAKHTSAEYWAGMFILHIYTHQTGSLSSKTEFPEYEWL
jgi:hypothetical protein